ncbi:MAG: hypothetical protein Q7V14_01695 [Coriobacteriia bacterium]|nr:hypothetical protein [Coriobacteriia bacterium]
MMGYGGGYGSSYGGMMGGSWFGGILMLLFGALIVAGIVLLIIWAVRSSSGHSAPSGQAPSMSAAAHDEAIAIAKRRLANGEITAEQYAEIIAALGG